MCIRDSITSEIVERLVECAALGAEQSMRPELRIVGGSECIASRGVPNNTVSVDSEQLQYEDENKLGCARAIILALALQAALIIAIAICWKFRFFLR